MNELNQHKKSDKIKWVFTVIAFVLVFVMLAGVCLQVFGNGKIKPSEWGKKSETEQTQPAADNIVISPIESRGIELCSAAVPAAEYSNYGIDPQAVENVFELSVTYTPANTTFQNTNYTIAFKNPNSTWATGKVVTDYADLQHESGSKNAVLTVKKSFQEQIIVKAISERDNTKSATFTVDYVCEYATMNIYGGARDAGCDWELNVRWVHGTIAPEADEHVRLVVDLSDMFVTHMQTNGFTVERYYVHSLSSEEQCGESSLGGFLYMVRSVGNYYSLSQERRAAYDYALGLYYANYQDGDGCGAWSYEYDRIYNGKDFGGSGSATERPDDWIDIDFITNFSEYFEILATALTTNNSQIVVG